MEKNLDCVNNAKKLLDFSQNCDLLKVLLAFLLSLNIYSF